jgi:hypothetical protein
LECFDSQASGLFGSIRINFYSVSPRVCPFHQVCESHAVSHAGVNCGKFIRGSQAISETPGLDRWKWEETQFCFAMRTHREPLLRLNAMGRKLS